MYPFLIFIVQVFFSTSDLLKKFFFRDTPFTAAVLLNPKFIAIAAIAAIGFPLQMYVLSRYDLSRTAIFMGIFAVILSPLFAVLFLHEKLSPVNWLGVGLAIVAIALVNVK